MELKVLAHCNNVRKAKEEIFQNTAGFVLFTEHKKKSCSFQKLALFALNFVYHTLRLKS